MDINEIREKKKTLESEIRSLIIKFTKETGEAQIDFRGHTITQTDQFKGRKLIGIEFSLDIIDI